MVFEICLRVTVPVYGHDVDAPKRIKLDIDELVWLKPLSFTCEGFSSVKPYKYIGYNPRHNSQNN